MWSRHLTGERGADLLHPRLDQRVAYLPHLDVAARGGDLVAHRLRALDLADEPGARDLVEQRLAEQDHELVAPQDRAGRVDHAEAIGVAVERDAAASGLRRCRSARYGPQAVGQCPEQAEWIRGSRPTTAGPATCASSARTVAPSRSRSATPRISYSQRRVGSPVIGTARAPRAARVLPEPEYRHPRHPLTPRLRSAVTPDTLARRRCGLDFGQLSDSADLAASAHDDGSPARLDT